MAPVDEEMAFEQRYVSVQPNLDESAWTLSGRLPGYAGRVVVAALEAKADVVPVRTRSEPVTHHQQCGRAVGDQPRLDQGSDGATVDSHGPMVSVFVDATEAAATNAETGVTVEAGPQVGLNTLAAILCDGVVEVTARTPDGMPLAMGRRTRVIPPRLRRFILHRDGGGAPSQAASSRYRLQVHHITPWSEGGRTDAGNLSTVCWFHHHVVIHGQGFTIDPTTPPQRRRLTRPRIHAPPRRTSWRIA